jgi:hypothetical protein
MTEKENLIEGTRFCPKIKEYVPLIRCMFCSTRHMLECHHPNTCEEANCTHYQAEMEFEE